eukprot:786687-Pyramimonas_sp.AAC.1
MAYPCSRASSGDVFFLLSLHIHAGFFACGAAATSILTVDNQDPAVCGDLSTCPRRATWPPFVIDVNEVLGVTKTHGKTLHRRKGLNNSALRSRSNWPFKLPTRLNSARPPQRKLPL